MSTRDTSSKELRVRTEVKGMGGYARRLLNRLPGRCRVAVRGEGNSVDIRRVRRLRGATVIITGARNVVAVHPDAVIDGLSIVINGNGNRVDVSAGEFHDVAVTLSGNDNRATVAEGCVVRGLSLVAEDDGNEISVHARTEFAGSTELAALEGTSISVGERCLFSGGVHVRTGDSHSITDLNGRRINPSRDISIGEHVWIGRNVTILKGARLPDSSVVGASSVVTKEFAEAHCVIAGNPASVVRTLIDWRPERIGTEQFD